MSHPPLPSELGFQKTPIAKTDQSTFVQNLSSDYFGVRTVGPISNAIGDAPEVGSAMPDTDKAVIGELTAKLEAAEAALLNCERREVANRFAGAVIHEVNNPLEALSNPVYLTKIQPEVPRQVVVLMETAKLQLRRMGDITRKTLSFFRDQAEAKDFDLIDIAESALTLHALRTSRQNVELRKRFRSPAVCKKFGGEILQIVSNFILNALDALPTRDAVLCLRVKTFGEHVVLTVADNGTGIEKAVYDKLFAGHHSTKPHGTGIGLWVSNNFALKHGGMLACRTSTRVGRSRTTFRLTIPCKLVVKAAKA